MESLCAVKLKRSDKAFINAYADLLTNGCSDKIYVSDICKKAGYTELPQIVQTVQKEAT